MPSANTIKTNQLTELVAVRMAETAAYLKVGSNKYFADQLIGKRSGQTYSFTKRDTGAAVNSLSIGNNDDVSITEKEIKLTLSPWHIAVQTNAIEAITDINTWDEEVAVPNGRKLCNAVVRDQIAKDLGNTTTAFVGSGFRPLAKASAHLQSISTEKLYGFIDPNVEAILTTNGQQFQPVGTPNMYSKGALGTFHSCEYYPQRFIANVTVSADLVTAINSATVSAVDTSNANYDTITLSASVAIPRGFVFHVDGAYAADLVGDPTSVPFAFVAYENGTNGVVKVRKIEFTGGAKEIVKADGSEWTANELVGKSVSTPCEAGTYFGGFIRLNGCEEFETLDKLDVSNADTKSGSVDGIHVHENRAVDIKDMTNYTRWDVVTLAGVVEKRGVAWLLVK